MNMYTWPSITESSWRTNIKVWCSRRFKTTPPNFWEVPHKFLKMKSHSG
jgi:hypothetical protein